MVSVFPTLLDYSILAPFLLRLGIGIIFIIGGIQMISKTNRPSIVTVFNLTRTAIYSKIVGLIKFIVGILLLIGLFTQIAALLSAVCAIIGLVANKVKPNSGLASGSLYWLILLISISLLLLGAGKPALDLPL